MNLDKEIETSYPDLKKSELQVKLGRLSRICQNLGVPILIMVDGFESSGKGYVINELTEELNPKYFDVEVFEKDDDYDNKFPFAKRFFVNAPKKGHIKIFDRSFYYKLFDDVKISSKDFNAKIRFLEKIEIFLEQ